MMAPKRVSTFRLSSGSTLAASSRPKTDISSLPYELHAEILDQLDHWIHILTADQVCQSWRHLLRQRVDLSNLYEDVYLFEPVSKTFGDLAPHQACVFGSPQEAGSQSGHSFPPPVFDHKRHLLFQECTIAYRCSPEGKPELKVHTSKNTGFFDRHCLSYYHDGKNIPKFYKFYYNSLFSSPVIVDPRPLTEKTRVYIEMKKPCSKREFTMMKYGGDYLTIGETLKLLYATYSECFKLECSHCQGRFGKAKLGREWTDMIEGWDAAGEGTQEDTMQQLEVLEVGQTNEGQGHGWTIEAYEDFERNCRDFGIIVKENESLREAGTMVLTVSPGESW
ncbi:hypothetical protein ABW19_dt0201406 [Dactylella cylindrospora]|nr:hypothetical protein ABW19_dt0201406 [Dactylella cylindrospora]